MRGVDRKVREALEDPHPLKVKEMPKYLEQAIDREIEAWLTWKQAHAPRKVEIDLSQLAGIRSAAAVTREALLTDEERDQDTAVETVEKTPTQDGTIRTEENAQPPNWPAPRPSSATRRNSLPQETPRLSSLNSLAPRRPRLSSPPLPPPPEMSRRGTRAPATALSPLLRPHTCRHFSPKTKMPRRKRLTMRE